ncbi:MAG TPA: lytic transglycosylase domain-containing protein [Albitalea sp.]|uniref:lytic transglycosylase domain-containing protein n=1 Tax=Piscinibacter sp. TaxID=1903157 RepID=UPI002ED270C7
MVRTRLFVALLALLCLSAPARACWQAVGEKYGIHPHLLYAMAKTESNLNARARNRNPNGSYDVGLMQINSIWLPTLARYGITEQHLLDPCINLEVGAWILAQNMRRLGQSWDAVGAYNAASPDKQRAYALKVYRNLLPVMLAAQPGPAQPPDTTTGR